MLIINLEQIIKQCCFICLFSTTLLYWIKTTNTKYKSLQWPTSFAMILCNIFVTILLIQRWLISNHFPLSNLYESSIFFVWTLTMSHILLEKKIQNDWLGSVTAPASLLLQCFATNGISKEMQQSTLLVPGLQSNWLIMHVSMMIFSYGLLFLGCLLAIILLTLNYNIQQVYSTKAFLFTNHTSIYTINQSLENLFFDVRKTCLINQLDYWSYRAISIGFILLTIGILSGAVWANEAWGSFWSWDPKETWALITWLIFAIYLHARMMKQWNIPKRAFIALFGLFVVWACYLGVNLLGKGLHSYGWLN